MATLTSEKWITTHEGLSLWSETFGVAGDKPVLLIMGLAMQLTGWPDELVQLLVQTAPPSAQSAPLPTPERKQLSGPVVDPDNTPDVVTNQSEVDDLLASLGF